MTAIPSVSAFHRHLDKCRQCRENPFALCLLGHALLTGEANEANPKTAIDLPMIVPPMARAPEIVDGVE